MLAILLITFPFFALVLCGHVAVRRGMLPLAAIPGLNAFVLYFALPCLLFRFGASTPVAQLLDVYVFGIYTASALVMVTLTILATRRSRIDWNNAAMGALVAAFPNTGFLGMPLLVTLLGTRAAGPAIETIVIDLLFTMSLCIALSRLDGGETPSAGAAVRRALKGVVTNPLPWAIAVGATFSATQLALPKPVMQTIGLLADAASPVALFTIGAVLARSQLTSPSRTPMAEYVPIALAKLLLHPLIVFVVGSAAIHIGLPLDEFALTAIVLVAALPSASNVSLLAEKFGADNGRIARIILLSTALAFLTFSGAVAMLAGGPVQG